MEAVKGTFGEDCTPARGHSRGKRHRSKKNEREPVSNGGKERHGFAWRKRGAVAQWRGAVGSLAEETTARADGTGRLATLQKPSVGLRT